MSERRYQLEQAAIRDAARQFVDALPHSHRSLILMIADDRGVTPQNVVFTALIREIQQWRNQQVETALTRGDNRTDFTPPLSSYRVSRSGEHT